ncbi:hypothetical protein Cni_G07263 [Canna indica]|uniref:PNPLA domain-containing protein n=1 Tax=Canna indica TaxID=4628 RepID=A0AAQ3JYG0_9LILI|nr:hypothetical protein Cni_G07263 [Canna indica]
MTAVEIEGDEGSVQPGFNSTGLRDIVKPVLISCYDLCSSASLVFSCVDAMEDKIFDFRLWEVCRTTWAKHGQFEPVEISSMDGATKCVGVDDGLSLSNPAVVAITHVLHNKQDFPFVRGVKDLFVLSLSSGEASGAATPIVAKVEDRKRVWMSKNE